MRKTILIMNSLKILLLIITVINSLLLKAQNEPSNQQIDTIHKTILLDNVTIRRNWIYQHDGNTIVNVEQIPGYDKYQADQIVAQLPGVTKSVNEGYKLNGTKVVFYINGIKQNISQESLDAYLQSLPATMLSEIELVNINSGKYGLEENAVIEIRTKRNIPEGINNQPGASFKTFDYGFYEIKPNYFFMIKKHRWLFYNYIAFEDYNPYQKYSENMNFNNVKQINKSTTSGRLYALRYNSRLSYGFKNDNLLEFSTYIYYDQGRTHTNWLYRQVIHNENTIEEKYYKTHSNDDLWNANISYTIPKKKLSFHGILYYNLTYGGLRSKNSYYNNDENGRNKYMHSKLNTTGWMHTFAGNMESVLGKWELQYGFQFQYNKLNDDARYVETETNKKSGSKFNGYELNSASYFSIKYLISQALSVKATMNFENLFYRLHFTKESINRTQRKYNLFPSLLIFYNTTNYNATLGFISNQVRPDYLSMAPSTHIINEFYYEYGNPELKSTRNYSLIFNNTLFRYLYINFKYTYFHNAINKIYSLDEKEHTYATFSNYANMENYKIDMVLPFKILKGKLYGQVIGNFTYVKYKKFNNSFIPPKNRNKNYWLYNLAMSMQYDITDRFNMNLQIQYVPKRKALLYTSKDYGYAELGLVYSALKNKNLLLSLSISNPFNIANQHKDLFYSEHIRNEFHYTRGNIINLSIRLRINRGQQVVNEYNEYTPNLTRMPIK